MLWTLVLAIALVVLFLLRRNPEPADYTLGGPLFQIPHESVEGLLVTRDRAQYRLDRQPSGYWSLSGALSDFLDQDAVETLLKGLTNATGGRLLAGSEPEDRRYEFNGPDAIRMRLFGPEGTMENLAIGTSNPVTGLYYGTGAGRSACFPVAPGLRERLAAVPSSLRLTTLLPPPARGQVQELEVWRGGERDLLKRHEGRWWLAQPQQWDPGSWFRAYRRFYDDRQTSFDGRTWLLANDAAVNLLIYEVTRVKVRAILAPEQAAQLSEARTLPWRRVILRGGGVNPDPSDGVANELEIAFLESLEADWVPALRRGHLIRTDPEAISTLSQARGYLLDSRAVAFSPSLADSMSLTREGLMILKGHRDPEIAADEKRKLRASDRWVTDWPPLGYFDLDRQQLDGLTQNLLANLETTPTLRVLPPTQNRAVLKDPERVRLEFHRGGDGGTVKMEIGFLDPSQLPADSPELAVTEDGMDPVGLWFPGSGQLLQVPGHFITTARAWDR
jgi:hypothetical protein